MTNVEIFKASDAQQKIIQEVLGGEKIHDVRGCFYDLMAIQNTNPKGFKKVVNCFTKKQKQHTTHGFTVFLTR